MAFTLLPGDPWETDPELAFKLRLDQANSEFMSGNAAEARRLRGGAPAPGAAPARTWRPSTG